MAHLSRNSRVSLICCSSVPTWPLSMTEKSSAPLATAPLMPKSLIPLAIMYAWNLEKFTLCSTKAAVPLAAFSIDASWARA